MTKGKWVMVLAIIYTATILSTGCALKEATAEDTKPDLATTQEMDGKKEENTKIVKIEDSEEMITTTRRNIKVSNITNVTAMEYPPSLEQGYDIPILMYHAIDEYNGSGIQELYVTPANFESQMEYLKSEGFTPITFDDLTNIESIKKPVLITLDDGYKNNYNVYNILKKVNNSSFQAKATIFMIGKKIDTKSGLSTTQLKEMSDSGMISIQSHTETHPSLPSITNYQEELGDSKERLEEITGKKVNAIAYPSGRYDENVMEETKKYYDYAVTTVSGIANTSDNLYELKRIRINYSTSLVEFDYLLNQ